MTRIQRLHRSSTVSFILSMMLLAVVFYTPPVVPLGMILLISAIVFCVAGFLFEAAADYFTYRTPPVRR